MHKVPAISYRLSFWLILLLSPGVNAGEWSLPSLMAQLASVESRHSDYVEVRHMSLLGVPLKSEGELHFRFPGYLKKTVTKGGEGSIELLGDRLWIEQYGKVTETPLSQHPALEAFVATIRATLAGDLLTLQQYYRLTLSGSAEAWSLTLIPADASMGVVIREVIVHGSGSDLQRFETLETSGDSSVITIRGESG